MEFFDQDIKKEYLRMCSENPNIKDLSYPLMNVSDALKAYYTLVDYFSDQSASSVETMLVGIGRVDLLYSALGRQTVGFGNKMKYTVPIDICSTLFYGMVKNHSFSDGNKRTALLLLLYQLDKFNYLPKTSVEEFEKLVVATAANELPKEFPKIWERYQKADDPEIKTIAHFLRKNTLKKNHSYHLTITAKDMADALKQYNVNCTIENGKIHFERYLPSKKSRKEKVLRFSINFGGWTRCIGAANARKILSKLQLYNQISDYQSFINGEELFYSLIQDFEGPLRRLKDE